MGTLDREKFNHHDTNQKLEKVEAKLKNTKLALEKEKVNVKNLKSEVADEKSNVKMVSWWKVRFWVTKWYHIYTI